MLGTVCFFAAIAIIFSAINFFAYPLEYKAEIRTACAEHDVDTALVAAVIRAESRFRPNAVSHKGAVGLMQIMPATAEYIYNSPSFRRGGIAIGDDGVVLIDPKTNIAMGVFYLKYLLEKFGDVRTALMAYNAGEGNVAKWLQEAGTDKLECTPFQETNKYVEKVLNGKNFYKYRI